MVDLQRASAGSGKTYALTKYFIRFLIAVKPEGEERYRLRMDAEIPDALRQILAITFTNKATNEMQMRIVDKLDALAQYVMGEAIPDYLEDFEKELDTTGDRISHAAGVALKALLNNYSDFNVSTIDSFFQSVLRTFVYESNLTDNYQVELESGYVSRMGLDAVLDDVDGPGMESDICETRQWLRLIMDSEDSSKWNIFQKKESKPGRPATPYSSLLGRFSNIDTEEYRRIRGPLDRYLESGVDLFGLYMKLETRYETPKRRAFDKLIREARQLKQYITDPEYQNGRKDVGKPYAMATKILTVCRWNKPGKVKILDESFWTKRTILAAIDENPGEWNVIQELTSNVADAYQTWDERVTEPDALLWESLRVSFPFLGLLKAVSRKRREYLLENEAVELGETSMILNSIIGPSDTPFVYERMGNRLDHLLIDEFQDTSALQWANLKPLIDESLSRGNDNLIIGDAKQSIYRFRNADYELINTVVPGQLDGNVNVKGATSAENTNWRSDRRIVEWNNNLFDYIARNMENIVARGDDAKEAVREKFRTLYGNVVQSIHKKKGGYVEVVLDDSGRSRNGSESRSAEERARDLILDAIGRGYQPKDICILTRDNRACDDMASCLLRHNISGVGETPIEFVSEQSLVIGNSAAVREVETVLRSIAHDIQPRLNDKDEQASHGPGNIRELESHLILYRQMHPELTMAECMERFMDEGSDMQAVRAMLGQMQSLALPALVEAVISNFVSAPLRRADAPYLSAFQDTVLEYCEGHPADIPSFLKWWDRAKKSKAISSPEDVNAVSIMTAHKSKGLEFPVVIVTEPVKSGTKLGDSVSGKEWIWVDRSELKFADKDLESVFPPHIPVNITKELDGTALAGKLYENYDLETIDTLNLLYVTFTRAVNELYIFTQQPPGKTVPGVRTLGELIMEFVEAQKSGVELSGDFDADELKEKNEEGIITVTYGRKPEYKINKEKTENKWHHVETGTLTDYNSIMVHGNIRMREVSLPRYVEEEYADDEDDSRDPRSVGNVCHAVMEGVKVFDDLQREMKRKEVTGVVPQGAEFLVKLDERVMEPDSNVQRWFGGSATRVICERPVLHRGLGLKRPDRIMFFEDGSVEIVDYKFGQRTEKNERRHRSQVLNYVNYLKNAGYVHVTGWLWYMFELDPERRILKVAD